MTRFMCVFMLAASMLVPPLSRAAPDTFDAALALIESGKLEQARGEMQRLAEAGEPRAQDALAAMYLRGLGGPRDATAAMGWYCMLAHHRGGGREVAHAMWLMAEFHRTGGGLPAQRYRGRDPGKEDPLRAYFWFQVMANQPRFFEQVDSDAVKLGRIGRDAMARQLYEGERQLVERRLERWSPQPPSGRERCVEIPRD